MKKICMLCAAEFEAKRSDAVYCSNECRAKANYEIRKAKLSDKISTDNYEFNSTINLPEKHAVNNNLEVEGKVLMADIMQYITNAELEITHLSACISNIKAENKRLIAQKSALNNQIIELEAVRIKKLELLLELPDVSI